MRYFDRDGQPISLGQYEALFTDDDYRRVALSHIDDVEVSTVWLGLDHSLGGRVPMIFETMIFGGPNDTECWRWSTKEQALAGHDQVCAWVRDGYSPSSQP